MGILPLVTPSLIAGQVNPASSVAQSVPASSNLASKFALLVESKMSVSDPSVTPAAAQAVQPVDGTSDDAVLQGLERLRDTFSEQETRVSELLSGSIPGADGLITLQYAMMNYSILIDVTSKLAGKAAQGLDTLMKGS